MGHRNSRVSRCREGCGDPRNNFEENSGGGQGFAFFAPASENKWVSPLQSHNTFSGSTLFNQQSIDLFLRHRMLGRFLPDVDRLGLRTMTQKLRIGQVIVDDDIRRPEQFDVECG